jgi:hypothetical protein
MKIFDPRYNDLPKTEIRIHFEGSIRTQMIIDIPRQYHLDLPSYDAQELDKHVKVYDQLRNLGAVLEAFSFSKTASHHRKLWRGLPGRRLRIRQNRIFGYWRCASLPIGHFTVMTWTGTAASMDCCA